HGPRVADPVVEADLPLSRLCFEIRRGVSELQRHLVSSLCLDSPTALSTRRDEGYRVPAVSPREQGGGISGTARRRAVRHAEPVGCVLGEGAGAHRIL